MINRPSYAQLTLHIARASLQAMPAASVQTAHSAAVHQLPCTTRPSTLGMDRPLAVLIDIQRWRRKRATAR